MSLRYEAFERLIPNNGASIEQHYGTNLLAYTFMTLHEFYSISPDNQFMIKYLSSHSGS